MGILGDRRWIVPLVLLAIIASASYFRWEVLDERAVGDEVVKRERDRWTNEVWLFRYTTYGVPVENSRQLAGGGSGSARAEKREILLTRTMDILVMLLILWMYMELLRRGKRRNKGIAHGNYRQRT